MRLLAMSVALWAVVIGGCGKDDLERVDPGFDPGANPAGSCYFEASGSCDEYAEAEASQGAASSCTGAGGEWSSGLCPFEGRSALCTPGNGATRTYSYGEQATAALQESCAMPAVFSELEGEQEAYQPPPTNNMPDGNQDAATADDDAGA